MSENKDSTNPVKIFVRERPMLLAEFASPKKELNVKAINSSLSNKNVIVIENKTFVFDHIFYSYSTQMQLFLKIGKPILSKFLAGYNCTILASGQSGSGKTYSMGLDPKSENFNLEKAGMVYRILDNLFSEVSTLTAENNVLENEVSVSFIEIYNDKVFDLFSDNPSESILTKGSKFNGSIKKPISHRDGAIQLLTEANKNRHVRSTTLNNSSSRSHAIFTIHANLTTSTGQTTSSLNLVDLAGSEGIRRTGHQGIAMMEGVCINQGLLAIGKVLQALSSGNKVVPYRDSILTTVLQDSLNSNSFLSLLCCVSPSRMDKSETLSTLRFAQSCKEIKNNPKINSFIAENKKMMGKTPNKSYMMPVARLNSSVRPTPYKVLEKPNKPPDSAFKLPLRSSQNLSSLSHSARPVNRKNSTIVNQSTTLRSASSMQNLTAKNKVSMGFGDVSNFSLNLSSSTTVDQPTNQNQPMSFGPLLRQIEATIDQKLNNYFSSFQSSTLKPAGPEEEGAWGGAITTDNDVVDIMVKIPDFPPKSPVAAINLMLSPEAENSPNISNAPVTSTVVKAPQEKPNNSPSAIENITVFPRRNLEQFLGDSINDGEENLSVIDVPKRSSSKRRSRSVADVFVVPTAPVLSETVIKDNENDTTFKVPRRSSSRRRSKSLADSFLVPAIPVRRSIRIANRTLNESMLNESFDSAMRPTRKSTRLSSVSSEPPKSAKKPKPTKAKKETKRKINNIVLASYFNSPDPSKIVKKKITKKTHKDAVLEVLNNGSLREIKMLPCIGLKTAFQVVSNRTLNGRFKKIEDLSRIPMMKGKVWEKFLESNNLN